MGNGQDKEGITRDENQKFASKGASIIANYLLEKYPTDLMQDTTCLTGEHYEKLGSILQETINIPSKDDDPKCEDEALNNFPRKISENPHSECEDIKNDAVKNDIETNYRKETSVEHENRKMEKGSSREKMPDIWIRLADSMDRLTFDEQTLISDYSDIPPVNQHTSGVNNNNENCFVSSPQNDNKLTDCGTKISPPCNNSSRDISDKTTQDLEPISYEEISEGKSSEDVILHKAEFIKGNGAVENAAKLIGNNPVLHEDECKFICDLETMDNDALTSNITTNNDENSTQDESEKCNLEKTAANSETNSSLPSELKPEKANASKNLVDTDSGSGVKLPGDKTEAQSHLDSVQNNKTLEDFVRETFVMLMEGICIDFWGDTQIINDEFELSNDNHIFSLLPNTENEKSTNALPTYPQEIRNQDENVLSEIEASAAEIVNDIFQSALEVFKGDTTLINNQEMLDESAAQYTNNGSQKPAESFVNDLPENNLNGMLKLQTNKSLFEPENLKNASAVQLAECILHSPIDIYSNETSLTLEGELTSEHANFGIERQLSDSEDTNKIQTELPAIFYLDDCCLVNDEICTNRTKEINSGVKGSHELSHILSRICGTDDESIKFENVCLIPNLLATNEKKIGLSQKSDLCVSAPEIASKILTEGQLYSAAMPTNRRKRSNKLLFKKQLTFSLAYNKLSKSRITVHLSKQNRAKSSPYLHTADKKFSDIYDTPRNKSLPRLHREYRPKPLYHHRTTVRIRQEHHPSLSERNAPNSVSIKPVESQLNNSFPDANPPSDEDDDLKYSKIISFWRSVCAYSPSNAHKSPKLPRSMGSWNLSEESTAKDQRLLREPTQTQGHGYAHWKTSLSHPKNDKILSKQAANRSLYWYYPPVILEGDPPSEKVKICKGEHVFRSKKSVKTRSKSESTGQSRDKAISNPTWTPPLRRIAPWQLNEDADADSEDSMQFSHIIKL